MKKKNWERKKKPKPEFWSETSVWCTAQKCGHLEQVKEKDKSQLKSFWWKAIEIEFWEDLGDTNCRT